MNTNLSQTCAEQHLWNHLCLITVNEVKFSGVLSTEVLLPSFYVPFWSTGRFCGLPVTNIKVSVRSRCSLVLVCVFYQGVPPPMIPKYFQITVVMINQRCKISGYIFFLLYNIARKRSWFVLLLGFDFPHQKTREATASLPNCLCSNVALPLCR